MVQTESFDVQDIKRDVERLNVRDASDQITNDDMQASIDAS